MHSTRRFLSQTSKSDASVPMGSSAIHNVNRSTRRSQDVPSDGIPVAVNAYYIAKSVDILKLSHPKYASAKQVFQPKSVMVTLSEE